MILLKHSMDGDLHVYTLIGTDTTPPNARLGAARARGKEQARALAQRLARMFSDEVTDDAAP